MYKLLFTMLLTISLGINARAQEPLTYTQSSQLAKAFQRIGTTDIEIVYHAPLARGRTVYGNLVTYNDKLHGKPQPWRAGANQNTTIRFGHDVFINGKPIKAGIYGLHIFVSENSWELVFSSDYKAWGSFTYTPSQDVLRVATQPLETAYQDWLSYRFLAPKAHEVTIELHWADKSIQFDVSTNVHANIIADVSKTDNASWSALLSAAKSVLQLDPQAFEKAMTLTEASILHTANLSNRMFKAGLLEKMGNTQRAEALRAKAIGEANANELFSLAMTYNNEGEDKQAIKILSRNLRENPKHWMAYLGYANYYRTHEDKQALEYYEKALALAPEASRSFTNYQYGYAKRALGVN